MNFGDILIGAGSGVGRGAQNAAAIQNVWANREAMERERELAPLRLRSAQRADELGALQLDKARRDDAYLKSEWNPLGEDFVKYMDEDQLASYKEKTKGMKTREDKQRFIQEMVSDRDSLTTFQDISRKKAIERITGLENQRKQLIAGGKTVEADALIPQIEQEMLKAKDQSKALDSIVLAHDATKVYNKLPDKDKKELEKFKDTPELMLKAIVAKLAEDKNLNMVELAYKAAKGDKEAAAALNLLEKFNVTTKGAGKTGKQPTPAMIKEIDSEISRAYMADPKMKEVFEREIRRSVTNKTSLFGALDSKQQLAWTKMKEDATELLKTGEAPNSIAAARMAIERFNGRTGTGEAMRVGPTKPSTGEYKPGVGVPNPDFAPGESEKLGVPNTEAFNIKGDLAVRVQNVIDNPPRPLRDQTPITLNRKTGDVTIHFADGTTQVIPQKETYKPSTKYRKDLFFQ